jgi:hypothetical protein
MLLAALAVLAVVTVPLAGGRLSLLADLQLRWVLALAAALLAQIAIISILPGDANLAQDWLHLGTYVVALAWVIANREIRWRWTIVTGGLLNFVVISANGGVMPASRAALAAAHGSTAKGFTNSGAVAHPVLSVLGDIFATPAGFPLHNVFSIGDVLIVLGIFVILHRQCESYLAYRLARAGDSVLRVVHHRPAAGVTTPG